MNVILSDLIAPSELQSLSDEYARAHRHYNTWTHIEALMTAAALDGIARGVSSLWCRHS